MNDPATLTDKQLRIIPHLLASPSIEEACARAKIAKSTLYGWLKDDAFRKELGRQRQQVAECALETLKGGVTKATETLIGLLDSNSETIQRGAANDVLGYSFRVREFEELEERLEKLEIAALKHNRR